MTKTSFFDNFRWTNNFELHFVELSLVLKACFEASQLRPTTVIQKI